MLLGIPEVGEYGALGEDKEFLGLQVFSFSNNSPMLSDVATARERALSSARSSLRLRLSWLFRMMFTCWEFAAD